MTLAGVVVPAHNEEHAIGRLLEQLNLLEGTIELAVVCNGCTDATATVASGIVPWATVVELDVGSKPAALRAGDVHVSAMPRLYLDADVMLRADAIPRLVASLTDDVLVVAPTPRYDTEGSTPLVRSHYRIWTALNAGRDAVFGTGAIMVSAAGRSRFAEWPDVIADDFFVDRLFGAGEKHRVGDVEVVVTLPRRFWDCVSRKARVHQGNRDVINGGLVPLGEGTDSEGSRLFALLRAEPTLWLHVPAHVVVTVTSRALSAWRRRRGTARTFYRDASTRGAPIAIGPAPDMSSPTGQTPR